MTETATTHTPEADAKRPSKWHDSKGKLAAVAAIAGLILGSVMFAGDKSAAEADSKRMIASAKKERASIIADAKEEREEMLGEAGEEKDTLAEDVAKLRKEKAALAPQVATLRTQLGSLKKQKAQRTFEGNGIYMVGADITPGTYRAAASPGCYYAVLANLSGTGNDIIANGNVDGPVVIQVPSSAKGVEVTRCGTFTRVG